MRYYAIVISGAPATFPARYEHGAQWGTIYNGEHDAEAQQIEFQITEYDSTTPTENSTLTIHGVSWEQIQTCNQLVGLPITIWGGMSPGLPLATWQSQREKFLMEGTILKCWGNWIGTETSIGMSFLPSGIVSKQSVQSSNPQNPGFGPGGAPGAGPNSPTLQSVEKQRFNRTGFRSIDNLSLPVGAEPLGGFDPGQAISILGGQLISSFDIGSATSSVGGVINSFFGGGNVAPLSAPLNIIHNMMPNMPLSSAVKETLSRAFPFGNIRTFISSALKLGYQDAGMYQSLEQYAGYINKLSQSILGTKAYQGVHISSHDQNVNVWDGTTPVGNGEIHYLDLIGQPTWLDINTIHVKVVLRGGLYIGYEVTLPQTLVGFSGPDSVLPFNGMGTDQRTHITLPGNYTITKVMHIGDFRNPDGASWSTNLELRTNSSISGARPLSDTVTKSESPAPPVEPFDPNVVTPAQRELPPVTPKQQFFRTVRRYG